MTHLPLDHVQTAILYKTPDDMASPRAFFSFLIASLNAALAEHAGMFLHVNAEDGSAFGLIRNPQNNLHITVEVMSTPMSLSGFQSVLEAPFYHLHAPGLITSVTHHGAGVLVGVGLGSHPTPLNHPLIEKLDMAGNLGGHQDQAKFELRLLILQTLSSILCRMSKPAVVHWSQSDQLFAPAEFIEKAGSGFSLPLYVSADMRSSGEKKGKNVKVGIRAHGSHHMIGHYVHLDENPRSIETSYQTVLDFVAQCRLVGRVPRAGETFEDLMGDVFDVLPFTTPDFPLPQIKLRLRSRSRTMQRPRSTLTEADGVHAETNSAAGRAIAPVDFAPGQVSNRSAEPSGPATYNLHHGLQTTESQRQTLADNSGPAAQTTDTTGWIKGHFLNNGTLAGNLVRGLVGVLCLYVLATVIGAPGEMVSLNAMN